MSNESQVSAEMPRYKCHKEVHALEIGSLTVHPDGHGTIHPRDDHFAPFDVSAEWMGRCKTNTGDTGYYVVYADGYKSWSPSEAFREGYTEIA